MWDTETYNRFLQRAIPQPNGCWQWTGAIDREGYGHFYAGGGKTVRAHRFAFEYHNGPMPNDLVTDHICCNRACVNPLHLRAVTNKVNVLRGDGHTAHNARRRICKRGHALSPDNIYVTKKGYRSCRQCQNIRHGQYRKQARAELRRLGLDE